jgi:hypothetical protein
VLPENFRFSGGAGETTLHPFVMGVVLCAVVLILLLRRKYVVVPLLLGTFLVLAGQAFVLGGLHIYVWRILILAGWVRFIASRSSPTGRFAGGYNSVDKVFSLWATFHALAFILLFPQIGAVVNQFGFLLDALGGYLLLRYLIRDDEDIRRVIRTFAFIAAILSVTMLYERATAVNLYGVFAGIPIIPELRDGNVRAQGPFEHALLAGTCAATLLPLFFWLWKSGKSRILGIIGMVSSTLIPLATQCSTPVLAYGAAVLGLCFWPFRRQMRLVRWGIVWGLVGLQIVMKAPFWWVIQHVDVVGESSGWHRAELVDLFLRHFFDWWLIGTKDNATWGHMTWDLCNQYVAEGEGGGLATLVCFIAMICICFRRLGVARKTIQDDRKKEKEWYFWIFGAALFSHVVAYLGISYFDQTRFSWFALLAMISAATAPVRVAEAVQEEAPHARSARLTLDPAPGTAPAEPA